MKPYRVGLDVGTASLGVAAFSLNAQDEPVDLVWHCVRLFDEPLEKGQAGLKSKKAARREARLQRRQIERRAGRLRRIAALAPLLGLTLTPAPDSGTGLTALRARAARERVELDELLRIFLRLAKRRGYAGEFRPKRDGARLGEVEGGSQDLEEALRQLANELGRDRVTLGEYLHHRQQQGLPTRLKVKAERTDVSSALPNLYALRRQVEEEFSCLWATQAEFHPILRGKRQGRPLREIFHEAILHQRPIKSAADLTGRCPLEPTLPRAPRAQPAFQRFRIEKTLADLRWGAGQRAEPLTPDQKSIIRQLLDERDAVGFATIYAALERAGHPRPPGRALNLDRLSRDELPGNKTHHALRRLGLLDAFRQLDDRDQMRVINFLAELGSPEQLDDPAWATRFVTKDGAPRYQGEDWQAFIGFIDTLRGHEKFDRLSKMGFDGGRASYSIKALRRLTEWLADPWWPAEFTGPLRPDEENAVRVCYPGQGTPPAAGLGRLPAAKATGNTVVDGALRQMRFVLNRMIDDLGGPPTEIVVEMTRDLGAGMARRNERERENDRNRRARKAAEQAIQAHGASPTPSRVRRYLLWREQGEKYCPYCDRTITLADALNGAETEYEHIVPRSLSQIGMKRSEIVLAHRHCNQEKGNRTPWEAWGEGRDPARWNLVEQRAAWFEDQRQHRKARLLRLRDHETEVLTDESIAGFADRQFHQTSWIAREAAAWLRALCPHGVSVSRGQLTALLRRHWGLETVIPEARLAEGRPVLDEDGKPISAEAFGRYQALWEGHPPGSGVPWTDRRPDKRLDHRHHLIDAITLAMTSRGLYQKMARQYREQSESAAHGEHPRLRAVPPPVRNLRRLALRAVRECRLSFKPDRRPGGAFFQDTAYGVAQPPGQRPQLTLREPLDQLIDRRQGTVEQARKAIAAIVGDRVRAAVSTAFEERIARGMSPGAALAEPIVHSWYGRELPIHKVRRYTGKYLTDAVAAVRHVDRQGIPHVKHLLLDGYACLETECQAGRCVQHRLVTLREHAQQPHPRLAPGVSRLYKGDTVRDEKDGGLYRVAYFKAEGNIFLVPVIEPRAYDAVKEAGSGKKSVRFSQSHRLTVVD